MTRKILAIILLSLLVGCAKPEVAPIAITTVAASRPELILPPIDEFVAREVVWIILTSDNAADIIAASEENGLFVLDANNYEKMAINTANARKLIFQQKAIIEALTAYTNDTKSN
jgi:hypothetical protein